MRLLSNRTPYHISLLAKRGGEWREADKQVNKQGRSWLRNEAAEADEAEADEQED